MLSDAYEVQGHGLKMHEDGGIQQEGVWCSSSGATAAAQSKH